MKRAILSTMLAVGLLVSMVVPAVAAEPAVEPMVLFQPDLYEAELAYELDFEPTVAAQGLPRVTPYWVDMVNGEYYPEGGEGIYVAVLDTGLMENWEYYFGHANIATEWGKGFSHDVYWCDDAEDIVWGLVHGDRGFLSGWSSGHGTHVTSTIVGFNFFDQFIVDGVAPKATIIPVLCLDAWAVQRPDDTWYTAAGGSWEMVSAAIRYIGDLAEGEGIKIVVNMSLGGGYSPMVEQAVDYAISKGVIVVASAGNAGYAGMGWPGALPQVISTGAGGWTEQYLGRPPQTRWWLNDVPEKLNTEDYWGNNWQMYLADFSSRPNKDLGQKSFHLDVTTPGRLVVGPYRGYFNDPAEGYYFVSGTSMAAPHVSGIAAIVLEEYPHLNQYQMEFILKNVAQGLPLAADGAYVYGWRFVEGEVEGEGEWVFALWHEEWSGNEYGAGWLTADRAMARADVFTLDRFSP